MSIYVKAKDTLFVSFNAIANFYVPFPEQNQ